MDAEEINLGFLEPERRVPRWFFPSKVGGLPAWQRAPPPSDIFCLTCSPQVPLTLLAQVYAPVEGFPQAFHRTVYVFCCAACGSGFRAVTAQLPRFCSEYPSVALGQVFDSKEEFWSLWKSEAKKRRGEPEASDSATAKDGDCPVGSDGGCTDTAACEDGASAKLSAVKQLLRGERLRQCLCCPVCGLSGGESLGGEALSAARGALARNLKREETLLERKLQRRKREAVLTGAEDSSDTGDRFEDVEDFENLETDLDERGLFELDSSHAQECRVLHPRCLKRLEFNSVCVAFPECPLAVETEELPEAVAADRALEVRLKNLVVGGPDKEKPLSYEEELLRRYQEEVAADPEADLDESEMDAFEELHKEHTSQDPQLEVFLKRCSRGASRGHVLRYAIGGKPLWPFSHPTLKQTEVPPCDNCGAPRQFEFQIQPQIIAQLTAECRDADPATKATLERLCFAVLAVFTCSAHCEAESPARGFRTEFVFAQPDPLAKR